jgi:hypothetical protein
LIRILEVRRRDKEGFAFGLENNRVAVGGQKNTEIYWDGIRKSALSERLAIPLG